MSNFRKNSSQKLENIKSAKQQTGVVLLEALIAILIFSFGLLAIAGLQGAMVKNTTNSNYRAEASYIVQQAVGRMWANPANINAMITTPPNIANRLPNGALTITRTINNRINFLVTWQTPGEAQHNFETNASIDVN
jgi:type IV pilus assembly protein PilV